MGTGLEIVVWAPQRSTCLTASEAGVRALEDTERRLSTWQEGSEFTSLNRATLGSWQDLSPTTAVDLKRALDLAHATHGLFDPTLGHLVQAWDLRGAGRRPSAVELEKARSRCGYQGIECEDNRFRRTQDVLLEEGAFGKGAGLDRAASALMAAGAQAASLNLGGQWLFVGPGDWSVQLAHPTHRTEAVLGLRLPPGSMATSANSERMLKLCDGELGHLLDPRTGIPSSKTHSVSVWARSALVADALSTALFIDPSRAAEFAQRFDAEVILLRVTETGLTASITPGLVKGSDPLTPNLRIIPLVYQQAH
jgi:thiamine biosynthesis lipoprotein